MSRVCVSQRAVASACSSRGDGERYDMKDRCDDGVGCGVVERESSRSWTQSEAFQIASQPANDDKQAC